MPNNFKRNGTYVDINGTKRWFKDDKYHRLNGPAIERNDGVKIWYKNGKLHRLNGPAVELENGTKSWYVNNKYHRLDGPAIERIDGSKSWYVNDRWLGDDDTGFWALWDMLTNKQRNNLNLLMHLPRIKK